MEFTCDVSAALGWWANGIAYLFNRLQNGDLPGHNVSGSNILITSNPMNNSQYVCSDGYNNGGMYRILVAGEYADLFACAHMSNTYTIYNRL